MDITIYNTTHNLTRTTITPASQQRGRGGGQYDVTSRLVQLQEVSESVVGYSLPTGLLETYLDNDVIVPIPKTLYTIWIWNTRLIAREREREGERVL